jgi:hypothetical protein
MKIFGYCMAEGEGGCCMIIMSQGASHDNPFKGQLSHTLEAVASYENPFKGCPIMWLP